MPTVEQVKASINGLSDSDQTDVLMHMLRLKYRAAIQEIQQVTASKTDPISDEALSQLTEDELLEKLNLLKGIREGLLSATQEQLFSHEDVKKQFKL